MSAPSKGPRMESYDARHRPTGGIQRRGEETPEQRVERAVGVIASLEGSGLEAARRRLRDAARRAGVSEQEIARGVLLFHTHGRAQAS